MFKICIENFEIQAIIGILEKERKNAQKIVLNLEIEYKMSDNFLDYAKVVEIVQERFQEKNYYLLEDALLDMPEILHNIFRNIQKIKFKIQKPNIIDNATVGIETTIKFNS